MNTAVFFQKIRSYTTLTPGSEMAWAELLKEKIYHKGDYFIKVGQVPKKVAFICEGLFSQYYITDHGDTVIKYFFPEGRIAGSIPATLTKSESRFTIEAIENTTVLEYDFNEFKKLVLMYKLSLLNQTVRPLPRQYLYKHLVFHQALMSPFCIQHPLSAVCDLQY